MPNIEIAVPVPEFGLTHALTSLPQPIEKKGASEKAGDATERAANAEVSCYHPPL